MFVFYFVVPLAILGIAWRTGEDRWLAGYSTTVAAPLIPLGLFGSVWWDTSWVYLDSPWSIFLAVPIIALSLIPRSFVHRILPGVAFLATIASFAIGIAGAIPPRSADFWQDRSLTLLICLVVAAAFGYHESRWVTFTRAAICTLPVLLLGIYIAISIETRLFDNTPNLWFMLLAVWLGASALVAARHETLRQQKNSNPPASPTGIS